MGKFYESIAQAITPYVKALAWWQTVPRLPKPKKGDAPQKQPTLTRMASREEAGGVVDLPWLQPEFRFLVGHLFDAGPTSAGRDGPAALTWADLGAWSASLGVSLPLWQLRLIRRLSLEYITEHYRAQEWDAPTPWDRKPDRQKVSRHIKSIMRA